MERIGDTVLRVGGRGWSADEVAHEVPHDRGDAAAAEGARRALAVRELLRARADELGLAAEDPDAALGALLEREMSVPEPTADEARRFYDARPERFARPVRYRVEHILFAVLPGVPVDALRGQAEKTLFEARSAPQRFAEYARTRSNCPSGAQGGALGWLDAQTCVPEFFAALAGVGDTMPRLVRSRHGFHVVRVLERAGGEVPPYESVAPAVAARLRTRAELQAMRQYVALLAGRMPVEGCTLEAADSPLVR